MNRIVEYEEKLSDASCDLKDIKSFVFGGFNSRFWMMRKHINSLTTPELSNLPFYSWECISLET